MDLHTWPFGAIVALLSAVVSLILLLASRDKVCGAIDVARLDNPSFLSLALSCKIDLPCFAVFFVAGLLAFVSIQLSRCEYSYDRMRRSIKFHHRCGHSLASPCSLSVLWFLGCVSFVLQTMALPFYVCASFAVTCLNLICEGGTPLIQDAEDFFSDFGSLPGQKNGTAPSGVRAELASLMPNAYCMVYGYEDLVRHACMYTLAALMAVVSQTVLVSSVGAEWERASEELHYMQGRG